MSLFAGKIGDCLCGKSQRIEKTRLLEFKQYRKLSGYNTYLQKSTAIIQSSKSTSGYIAESNWRLKFKIQHYFWDLRTGSMEEWKEDQEKRE